MRDILIADESLIAWCNENYERAQTVYVGVNNEDPPDPDTTYPVLILFSATRQKSANVAVVRYSVELGAGIKDSSITDNSGNITYDGLLNVCALRELAENAIMRSCIGKIDINSDTWDDMLFPLFASNSLIEVEIPKNYSYRSPSRLG
jgi:hypothetical protein